MFMEKTKDFTELIVWQKAHQFVLEVYIMTKQFPREELFGITSQLRRAAISIAANIAEGYSKRAVKDKMRFLNIAQGSLSECRYYLILTRDLKYFTGTIAEGILEQVSKLLNSYRRVIDKNSHLHNSSIHNFSPPNSSPHLHNSSPPQ
jgi:four helix bundle protein